MTHDILDRMADILDALDAMAGAPVDEEHWEAAATAATDLCALLGADPNGSWRDLAEALRGFGR